MVANRLQKYWSSTEEADETRQQTGEMPDDREGWAETLGSYMGEYPTATIAVAIGLGVLLGWFTKRK